jgi:hypothetical protein
LLPDAWPPELLGFEDRTMMYEGEPRIGRPRCTGWRPIAPLTQARETAGVR